MADGFLGRWSRRKLDVKEGKALEAEPAAHAAAPAGVAPEADAAAASPAAQTPLPAPPPAPAPPPTLADADLLTSSSDFSRFAARDVAPEVRNAAMKKLFADPHFNVMDGLDIYIDDYSKPDPMPAGMLRQLASVKFLNLFDEKKESDPALPREVADNPTDETVAQSPPEPVAVPEPADDANPDLRLQPDDAASGKDPGRGTS